MPVNEQERQIGPLITQVTNRLPPEKRKAYLLRPQSMFTYQTLMEKILEADGITKEMLEDQQKRLRLLQRLLSTPQETDRAEIIRQEEALIDENFFGLLSRVVEAGMMQGDESLMGALAAIQQQAFELTAVGKRIQGEAQESQEALRSLQEASKTGLTREKLLEMIIAAPSEIRLNTLVTLARNGLDYAFYQLLTERIDKAEGEEKQRLTGLRSKLIEITGRIDKQIQAQMEQSRKVLDQILASPNPEQATEQRLGELDDFFIDAVKTELETARKAGNLERISQLQQVSRVIERASAPPPEIALVEELLSAEGEEALSAKLEEHNEAITPEFIQLLSGLIAQSEQQQQQPPELVEKLKQIYAQALRYSMQRSMRQ